jgi:hypothetical protein
VTRSVAAEVVELSQWITLFHGQRLRLTTHLVKG